MTKDERIRRLEIALNDANRRITRLEQIVQAQSVDVQAKPQPTPQPTPPQQQVPPMQDAQATSYTKPLYTRPAQANSEPGPEYFQPEKKSSIESKIGKTVMGVMAAALILFSIILFGYLIYDKIPDFGKAIIMFLVSGILTAAGLWLMKKHRAFIILASTGLSGIFVSGIITHYVYDLMGAPILYVIIGLWIFGTAYLARAKSRVFLYVCDVGILITTGLITQVNSNQLALALYMLFACILYLFTRTKSYAKDSLLFIQTPVVFMFLISLFSSYEGWICNIVCVGIILAIYILTAVFYKEQSELGKALQIVALVVTLFTSLILSIDNNFYLDRLTGSNMAGLIILVITMAIPFIWSYIYYRKDESELGKVFKYLPLYVFFACYMFCGFSSFYEDYIGLLPMAIITLALSFVLKDFNFRIVAVVYSIVYLMDSPYEVNYFLAVGFIFAIMLAYIVMVFVIEKEKQHVFDKFGIYILSISIYLSLLFENYWDYLWIAVVFSVAVGFFINSDVFSKYGQGKLFVQILGYLTNIVFYINAIVAVNDDTHHWFIRLLMIMAFIAITSINTKRLFERATVELPVGLYITFKYMIMVLVITNTLGGEKLIISLVGILFAIIIIAVGYFTDHKSFRLYGLVLSLICVFKIMLFDISYASNLLRPLGIFAAGILCFIISFIYSKLEKKQREHKDIEQNIE